MFTILITLLGVTNTLGLEIPPVPELPISQANIYIQDTPEVVEARRSHLAIFDEVRRNIERQNTTPDNIGQVIKAPEYAEITTATAFQHPADTQNGIYQKEKVINFEADDKEKFHPHAAFKIYLPHIIHNNNPYYKYYFDFQQNYPHGVISTAESLKISNYGTVNEYYVEKFVEALNRKSQIHYVPEKVHIIKTPIRPNLDSKGEEFVSKFVNEYFGSDNDKIKVSTAAEDHVNNFVSHLTNINTVGSIQDVIADAEEHVDSFVTHIENTNFNPQIKVDLSSNGNNAANTIDEVEVEKFLANLEEKYKNGTKNSDSSLNTVILLDKTPNSNLLFDQRFSEVRNETHLEKDNSPQKNPSYENADKILSDFLKLIDKQIKKFVDELLSKHDAVMLENIAKDLVLSIKNADIEEVAKEFVNKIVINNPKTN